jgi:hypothetical protein
MFVLADFNLIQLHLSQRFNHSDGFFEDDSTGDSVDGDARHGVDILDRNA